MSVLIPETLNTAQFVLDTSEVAGIGTVGAPFAETDDIPTLGHICLASVRFEARQVNDPDSLVVSIQQSTNGGSTWTSAQTLVGGVAEGRYFAGQTFTSYTAFPGKVGADVANIRSTPMSSLPLDTPSPATVRYRVSFRTIMQPPDPEFPPPGDYDVRNVSLLIQSTFEK